MRLCQKGVNESPLPCRIALRQPSDLPLPDHVHCFVSLNRLPRSFHRPEPQARCDGLLNEAVVLLHDVVQVGRWTTAAASAEIPRLLQLGDGPRIRWMSVYVDYPFLPILGRLSHALRRAVRF